MKIFLLWFVLLGIASAQINGNATGTISIFRSYQDSDLKNTLNVIPYQITTGGTTTTSTVNNRVYKVVTSSATITSNLQITSNFTGSFSGGIRNIIWNSSNPSVATINSLGYVTYVAPGTSLFTCSTLNPTNVTGTSYTFTTTGGTVTTFQNWAVTSPVNLPAQMNSNVDGLLTSAGSFSTSKLNLYSSTDDINHIYTRNSSVWTGSIDLSSIPVWTSYQPTFAATYGSSSYGFFGALITQQDMIIANHVGGAFTGKTIGFVSISGTYYSAIVSGSAVNVVGDLSVVHFTSPVNSAIHPISILPSNYQHFCPDYNLNYFPIILTNQFRQVFVQDAFSGNAFSGGTFYHFPATESNRSPWTANVIGGDSSNPVMAIINGQAVLLCCNFTSGTGPSPADNISAINSALASLGSSGTLTLINTTSPIAFPTY